MSLRDDPAPQKKPSGGLAACGNCGGVVPAAKLVTVGDQPLCPDCNRKFGAPVPASAAQSAKPADKPRIARDPGLFASSRPPLEIVPPRVQVTSTTEFNRRSLPGLHAGERNPLPVGAPRQVSDPARASSVDMSVDRSVDRSADMSADTSAAGAAAAPDASGSRVNDDPTIRDFAPGPRPAPTIPSLPPMRGRQASFSAHARRTMPEMQVVVDPHTGESRLVPRDGPSAGTSSTGASPYESAGAARTSATGDEPAPREQARITRFQPGGSAPASASTTAAPPRGPVPGFPHLYPAPPKTPPRMRSADDVLCALTEPAYRPEEFGPAAAAASVSRAGNPRASATGVAAPVSQTGEASESPPERRTSRDAFAEYAELRGRIDRGTDDLDVRRQAAELASRLGLTLEALEHYKRCVELAPDEPVFRQRYENVKLSAGEGRGGSAQAVPERRVPEEAAPFWHDLGAALAYPLQGRGTHVLVAGSLFFAIAEVLQSVNIFAGVLSVLTSGYIASYLFDVINSTGARKTQPPEMPEASSFLETYVFPLLSLVACAVVSYLPFAAALWIASKDFVPAPAGLVLCLAAFALGTFAMPMTLLVRAMFQTWSEPLNVGLVVGSIGRIFPDYIAMYVATCILWLGYGLAALIVYGLLWVTLGQPSADAVIHLDGTRMLAWLVFAFVSWPMFLYTWVLQGHLIGRLYAQGLRRLAWFVPPSDATRRAKRTSAAVVLGAAAATVLLAAGAWGASHAFTLMRSSGGGAAAIMAKCPIRPGARLAYWWESTDGMCGVTTYGFEPADGGKLRVVAVVRLASESGRAGPAEELGLFDPSTGVFTSAGTAWGSGVHFDGRKGEHVPFYGPLKANMGSAYVNQWPVKSMERWKDRWAAWRVEQSGPDRATQSLFFDSKSGVLVGHRQPGIGYVVTGWLVGATGVAGIGDCPPTGADMQGVPLLSLGE
ncbi:MAG: hypothetical protein HMLKMBBP_02069 [Planctomycetes bacterium]|nr:hypothetical protein [Planctomycetota bacterium]